MRVFLKTMASFFAARAERLQRVFEAGHTREHWTQAEAFLHFRENKLDLRANWYRLAKGRVADFSRHAGSAEVLVVSEFKIYGSRGFLPKNLTGRSQRRWPAALRSPTGRYTFGPNDPFNPREGSILRDYRRLLAFSRREPGIPAVLLLAIVNNGAENSFGSAIRRVDFGCKGMILVNTKEILVKAWRVRR